MTLCISSQGSGRVQTSFFNFYNSNKRSHIPRLSSRTTAFQNDTASMNPSGLDIGICDGGKRTAALLAKQWMRAEDLIYTHFPGDKHCLAAKRSLPWGTGITGRWLWEESFLAGVLWPRDDEVIRVAQILSLFNNSIEAVALRTSRDMVANTIAGCMVDPVGLRTLLEYIGKAFNGSPVDLQPPDAAMTATSGGTWNAVMDMAEKCEARFWKNTDLSPEILDRGQRMAQYIEEAQRTLFLTDLVRSEIAAGLDEEEARLVVLEGITLSRAAIAGELEVASFLNSAQTARRTKLGVAGSVLVDDWLGGRRIVVFTPWIAILHDGTICLIGPDGSWAVKFHQMAHVAGIGKNNADLFAPLTDVQRKELKKCPRGRHWPNEIRVLKELNLSTLANLGRLSASIHIVMKEIEKEMDTAYVDGCDEFSDRAEIAARRGLKTIQDLHPTAWDAFVSGNMITRSLLAMYEQSTTPSEFASAMTGRLVVGLSGSDLKVNLDVADRFIIVRSTGVPCERGISLTCASSDSLPGLSIHDMADGLGATEEQRRWMYAGLRIVSKRFDEVAGGNCVAKLLNDAEYRLYSEILPPILDAGMSMLTSSDVIRYDPRAVYRRKRAAIDRDRRKRVELQNCRHRSPRAATRLKSKASRRVCRCVLAC